MIDAEKELEKCSSLGEALEYLRWKEMNGQELSYEEWKGTSSTIVLGEAHLYFKKRFCNILFGFRKSEAILQTYYRDGRVVTRKVKTDG